ncbi:MAG: hypothetical protein GX089_09235 [Fibrobacter sp.]|jgi:HAMP domain-containing protein|nr:hypothetical protein [Fibrobacter sp.]
MRSTLILSLLLIPAACLLSCSFFSQEDKTAIVRLKNDFNNKSLDRRPPWTIAESSYMGKQFGKILPGDSSAAIEVEPGVDYVLMVACWDDTSCSTHNCLPLASKIEEEVVAGQRRTIDLNAPNHQGPCPPEGIEPIPEVLYNRILQLWPKYNFRHYSERQFNPQCQ